ncbi:hypothetical protein BIV60_20675 [Bacillus sp. MUM 116]|uniref:hypothetical protein n=1 Tax=Bacillus sp. MUM 116 TaxID=1678002 RepID=UPI0008F5E92C|nr:hypothetical protein [Bacillus sp. MUM 116]OIK10637.1 hypothetical protein BIV60_20675 [Bacillus sp. MUM 116]
MGYQIMFYGGITGALVTIVISIVLFVKMEIAQVFIDLTGIQLRKKRRQTTEESNENKYTKEIMLKKQYAESAAAKETELLQVEETALLGDIEETTLLSEETALLVEETTLLVENEFIKEVDVMIVHSNTII